MKERRDKGPVVTIVRKSASNSRVEYTKCCNENERVRCGLMENGSPDDETAQRWPLTWNDVLFIQVYITEDISQYQSFYCKL
jgi:hypothetical protein